ncbi:uroporphyrinogen-III synthase [Oceanobacillus senegalensis]|uniref:uroporphyrinogen-III synthase n=1 Tax=Oceanobacillus senegalensis TaxID=1936063 RepID=UPI000A31214F|nr:uroporphyrinogen-III synthase [Oceanobacillus senegalensis]
MSGPLEAKKIIVTREEINNRYFAKKILQYGGTPIEVPLLSITCEDRKENKTILNDLDQYEWIFFTSANGVECFFQLVEMYHIPFSNINNKKIAAVGRKTKDKLNNFGIKVDFIPTTFNAETMAKEFLSSYSVTKQVLFVRGNLSRPVLIEEFEKAGVSYRTIEVYKTTIKEENKQLLNKAVEGPYDFITFTSPSAIDAFNKLTEYVITKPCVCIGTTTKQRALERGITNILMPMEEFTIDAMIECMVNYIKERQEEQWNLNDIED